MRKLQASVTRNEVMRKNRVSHKCCTGIHSRYISGTIKEIIFYDQKKNLMDIYYLFKENINECF